MTITSVEHPPILTPVLRTVPLHSHVFISLVTTLSPLVLFQFLYPRVSIDSPEEPEATASDMVTSKSCGGKVPEGKDSITPWLLVVSFQMNTSWIETPTCRWRETWSFGPSPSLRSRNPTGATSWRKNGISSVTQNVGTEGMNNYMPKTNASVRPFW